MQRYLFLPWYRFHEKVNFEDIVTWMVVVRRPSFRYFITTNHLWLCKDKRKTMAWSSWIVVGRYRNYIVLWRSTAWFSRQNNTPTLESSRFCLVTFAPVIASLNTRMNAEFSPFGARCTRGGYTSSIDNFPEETWKKEQFILRTEYIIFVYHTWYVNYHCSSVLYHYYYSLSEAIISSKSQLVRHKCIILGE